MDLSTLSRPDAAFLSCAARDTFRPLHGLSDAGRGMDVEIYVDAIAHLALKHYGRLREAEGRLRPEAKEHCLSDVMADLANVALLALRPRDHLDVRGPLPLPDQEECTNALLRIVSDWWQVLKDDGDLGAKVARKFSPRGEWRLG